MHSEVTARVCSRVIGAGTSYQQASLARLLSPTLRRQCPVVSKQHCWNLQEFLCALSYSDSQSPRHGWEILLIRVEVLQLFESN